MIERWTSMRWISGGENFTLERTRIRVSSPLASHCHGLLHNVQSTLESPPDVVLSVQAFFLLTLNV